MSNGGLRKFTISYCRTCVPPCSIGSSLDFATRMVNHTLGILTHTDIGSIIVEDVFLDDGETPDQSFARFDAVYSARYV